MKITMKNILLRTERFVWNKMHNYMPRWTILIIDLFIVVFAFITLWLFRNAVAAVNAPHFGFKLLLVTILYFFSSILFKTYRGVIRFSTMSDLKQLTKSALFATFLFELVSIFANNKYFANGHLFSFNLWFPFVLCFLVIAGQLIFRFIVKSVFERFKKKCEDKKIRVFILGSEYESLLLSTSIKGEKANPYEPVAFISLIDSHAGKTVDGMPILSAKKGILQHMEHYKVNTLLLYKSQLDAMPTEFYDKCIVEGLELLMVTMFSKLDDYNGNIAPKINKIKIEDLLGRNAIKMDNEQIENHFNNKVVLITGAAGSIGSEIANQVSKFHCKKIILVDQAETPLNDLWLNLSGKKLNIQIKPIIGNVTSEVKMRQIFEYAKPDIVFHAAAYKHVPMMEFHPSAAVVTNVLGTKIVADLSVEFRVKRFIMISTDKAVNPTNVMGASKRAAEIYIQSLSQKLIENGIENPTQFVTTRFGNVLGSNGSVVPLFKRQIETGGPITITHKDITRYFMTIPEACSLVLEAGCMGNGGEIYMFDMGEAVKIYDLAEKMIRLSGKTPGKDIKIIEIGLRPGEKLYEELLSNGESTIPTYHKKVKIAKVRRYTFDSITPIINDLTTVAQQYVHPIEVVKLLKTLIPEYISQNSKKYEYLDTLELFKQKNVYKIIDK